MTTKNKSKAIKELEKIRKGPLLFKDLLHSIRITEELTQTALAKSIGVSRAKICDYEKGRRIPSLKIAAKLAKALGHSEVLFVEKLLDAQIKEAKLQINIKITAA